MRFYRLLYGGSDSSMTFYCGVVTFAQIHIMFGDCSLPVRFSCFASLLSKGGRGSNDVSVSTKIRVGPRFRRRFFHWGTSLPAMLVAAPSATAILTDFRSMHQLAEVQFVRQ